MDLAEPSLNLEIVEIADLPLYNPDLETDAAPQAWKTFRDSIAKVDAVLFVTPEYNRSVPGGLKNALDVGSRPYGKSVWSGKPGAIVSVSLGLLGAFGANRRLRQSLVFLNVPAMQQPEAYISNAADLIEHASGSRGRRRDIPEGLPGEIQSLDCALRRSVNTHPPDERDRRSQRQHRRSGMPRPDQRRSDAATGTPIRPWRAAGAEESAGAGVELRDWRRAA